jgi:hypothetical protein
MWKRTIHPALFLIWALALFTFASHLLELSRRSPQFGSTGFVENRALLNKTRLASTPPPHGRGHGDDDRSSEKGQGLPESARPENHPSLDEIPACDDQVSDAKSSASASGNYWRNLAVSLARLPAGAVLEALEAKDPFGVREFERRLKSLASDKKGSGSVTLEDIRRLFPCPKAPACRLAKVIDPASLPVPTSFRARQERIRSSGSTDPTPSTHDVEVPATNHTWILFQHLRKAGGTHFCSLAQRHAHPINLTRATLCCPDGRLGRRYLGLGDKSSAGSIGRFTNEQLVEGMSFDGGYGIAANEWDKFEARFLDLPAVLVTSFRDPVDRAVSQYLFECVTVGGAARVSGPCVHTRPDARGGIGHPDGAGRPAAKNLIQWWQGRNDLYNNYVQTFAPDSSLFRRSELRKIYASAPVRILGRGMVDPAATRAELVGGAYDVLQQFHLVTVMEWLEHATPMFRDVLGWNLAAEDEDDGEKKRNELAGFVRPGPGTGPGPGPGRGPSRNETVWQFEQALRKDAARIKSDPGLHGPIREFLALDMILNDAARRLFLERLVCNRRDEA